MRGWPAIVFKIGLGRASLGSFEYAMQLDIPPKGESNWLNSNSLLQNWRDWVESSDGLNDNPELLNLPVLNAWFQINCRSNRR